ncbi:hypothetical protein GDO81_000912 [Engystomops pustulosus]|uniref:Uncharacterized protein n=1 Tax=Engystomops pustulosus TaxID=76066 RepID=A0AAV7D843_ENGPU|nr:hypothetical protein GDO81_000912 [Engystomops pustulosus]
MLFRDPPDTARGLGVVLHKILSAAFDPSTPTWRSVIVTVLNGKFLPCTREAVLNLPHEFTSEILQSLIEPFQTHSPQSICAFY